ncbi:hypothetical protein LC593_35490 [Nostoc sp. CHAB 5844]|nr:hypothetical protein [Nostoc sp. CHAB 5844]
MTTSTTPPFEKQSLLREFRTSIAKDLDAICASRKSDEDKAKEVNALINSGLVSFKNQLLSLNILERGTAALTLQYCYTVIALESRHKVWPYEYMAFSRRIGEMWEDFCSVAWEFSLNENMQRIHPPSFSDIKGVIKERLVDVLGGLDKTLEGESLQAQALSDVDMLCDLVGDINMREDQVFQVFDVPHVVDFKSGFGSNEKGNTLRLEAVGRAYRAWNKDTKLWLLVRQEVNNNYLDTLRKGGLWEVYTGLEAYKKIDQVTDIPVSKMKSSLIDWENDLNSEFYAFLKKQRKDLTEYLIW